MPNWKKWWTSREGNKLLNSHLCLEEEEALWGKRRHTSITRRRKSWTPCWNKEWNENGLFFQIAVRGAKLPTYFILFTETRKLKLIEIVVLVHESSFLLDCLTKKRCVRFLKFVLLSALTWPERATFLHWKHENFSFFLGDAWWASLPMDLRPSNLISPELKHFAWVNWMISHTTRTMSHQLIKNTAKWKQSTRKNFVAQNKSKTCAGPVWARSWSAKVRCTVLGRRNRIWQPIRALRSDNTLHTEQVWGKVTVRFHK